MRSFSLVLSFLISRLSFSLLKCATRHFTIRGADGTDFEGGVYHGRILLPPDYPFKPPHIMFLTPSGRFDVNTKVCLSFSAFHPELWQPAWGIRLILEALISFLPTPADGAIGALDWSSAERKRLAVKSRSWECPCCGKAIDLLPKLKPKSDGDGSAGKKPKSRFQKEIEQLQKFQVLEHGESSSVSAGEGEGGGEGQDAKKEGGDDKKEEEEGGGGTDGEVAAKEGGAGAGDVGETPKEEDGKEKEAAVATAAEAGEAEEEAAAAEAPAPPSPGAAEPAGSSPPPSPRAAAPAVAAAAAAAAAAPASSPTGELRQRRHQRAQAAATEPAAPEALRQQPPPAGTAEAAAAAAAVPAVGGEVPAVVDVVDEGSWLVDPVLQTSIVILVAICYLLAKKVCDVWEDLQALEGAGSDENGGGAAGGGAGGGIGGNFDSSS
jgi:ubiquitin-conjugating enzyme E2 J1